MYAAWRLAKEDLAATYKHNFELDKSIKAWKWVSDRLAKGSPPLYLSPTVQELNKSPQVTFPGHTLCADDSMILRSCMYYSANYVIFVQLPYWADPSEVNMEELSMIEYIVSHTDFTIVVQQLPVRLQEIQASVPRGQPSKEFTNALTAAEDAASFTTGAPKACYHDDIRLYMEACLIAAKITSTGQGQRPPRLLVTEDYKFFKGFIRSTYAHSVLKDIVQSVLKIKDAVTILLAGHVIEGV